ncbi:hypothetical protein GCM10018987_42850 [Streptomyces cremeus]
MVWAGMPCRCGGDLAALLVQFGDALLQQVEQGRDRDGSGGELEEGEHLGDGLDDFRDGGGRDVLRCGVDDRPGVEEGDPAAQHGGVVAVPGAQPPAGAGVGAVDLDEAREARPVPAGPHLSLGQAQCLGGAFGGGVGEPSGLAGPGGGAAGALGVDPARHPGGVGEHFPCVAGQFRLGGGSLGRAGGRAGTPVRHGPSGCGEGSRADKSEPGVARCTGRHVEQCLR